MKSVHSRRQGKGGRKRANQAPRRARSRDEERAGGWTAEARVMGEPRERGLTGMAVAECVVVG